GYDGASKSDTWEWDGSAWTLRASNGPSPRSLFGMAYDSARRVSVVFGGGVASGFDGETWEWNGNIWVKRASSGPPPRIDHAMTYDSKRGVSVMFGGDIESPGHTVTLDGGTWEWDGASWSARSALPPARSGHAMAYDSARRVTVLFAGYAAPDGGVPDQGTWEWDGNLWQKRSDTGPTAR